MDPFTIEVVKEGLQSAAQEMFIALGHASYSPIIYEVLDYATGVTDGEGNLVAQGQGVPGFIGCLDFATREALAKFGARLNPGDVVAINDPHMGGGTHLNDITLLAPVFREQQRVAFVASKAHWVDVGGKDAGSWTPDATEVFQEGLNLPCVKIVERGRINHALLDTVTANIRLPEQSLGDFWAQIASLRAGERRVHELCDRHSVATVVEAMAVLQDQGHRVALQGLGAIQPGIYEAADFIEADAAGESLLPVRVRVTVTPERMICDFTGSAPQVNGPSNCTYSMLVSAARASFKAITDPGFPACDGCFRPLEVICPTGTIFTATRPAATSIYFEVDQMASDLVWKALAPALPARLTAGHYLSVCGTVLAGRDDSGRDWLLVEPQVGGWGAGEGRDGENGLFCVGDGETYIMPVEVAEHRYPVRMEQLSLNTEPGGMGRFRGGRGVVREYRLLGAATVTASFGRHKVRPWAVAGGEPGTANRIELLRVAGGAAEVMGKASRVPLAAGDRVRLVTGCGGGWGPAADRDPSLIERDRQLGYLTPHTESWRE